MDIISMAVDSEGKRTPHAIPGMYPSELKALKEQLEREQIRQEIQVNIVKEYDPVKGQMDYVVEGKIGDKLRGISVTHNGIESVEDMLRMYYRLSDIRKRETV